MNIRTLRILALICAIPIYSHAAAAIDLGSSTSRTPYDPYMTPVFAVMRQLTGSADPATVAQLVRQGKGFRYSYKKTEPYVPQTPEETESTRSGDCKAKSLWLASKMNDKKVRFVIGKQKQFPNTGHAWLIWESPEGWVILDATLFSTPLSPARLSPNDFMPTYSYSPSGKYSHAVAAAARGAKYGDHL